MTHDEFSKKWLGKRYCESEALGAQCVALAKLYMSEVYGIQSPKFGGSALTGWGNKSGTFDLTKWTKYTVPATIEQGDILFFDKTKTNPYGHVSVAHSATKHIEQNGGKGGGTGTGTDAIRLSTIPKGLLGFYRLKKVPNISQYVSRKEVASVAQALAPKEMVWNGERG